MTTLSDEAGGKIDAHVVELSVNLWPHSPCEAKVYPHVAKSSDPTKLAFIGAGPMMTVTAGTREDVDLEAGSTGPFLIKIYDDVQSCLPFEIKLENLLA